MNVSINVDWRFILALGSTAVGAIFAIKMDADAVERVSTALVDSLCEYATAN